MSHIGSIVKFTPSAVKQVKKLMESETDHAKKYLRVGAKNGGCAGFSYIFEFDGKTENDIEEEIDDFTMIIDKTQASLLLNLEVNYESGLNNRGFIFHNPNAKTTCGCGTSFG